MVGREGGGGGWRGREGGKVNEVFFTKSPNLK